MMGGNPRGRDEAKATMNKHKTLIGRCFMMDDKSTPAAEYAAEEEQKALRRMEAMLSPKQR